MISRFFVFIKSPIGKLHSSFALFILFNLLSGLVNLYIHPIRLLVAIHFYTGLLILLAPLVYVLTMKNRGMVLKAFSKMALLNRADFKKRRIAAILFKATALVILLLTLINALSGILFRFDLLTVLSYRIHTIDFNILLVIIPLHVILAAAMHSKHAVKPAFPKVTLKG